MLKGFMHRQPPVAAQRQAAPHVPVLRQHQTFSVRCHAVKPAIKGTIELEREEAKDTLKLDKEEIEEKLEGEKEEAKGSTWRFPVFPDVGSYASSLVSGLLQRNEPEEASIPAEEVLQEASNQEREMQDKAAPADISQFLSPVPVWELKHIRKLSHLCAISYKLPTVTQRALKRKHGLDLIMASWLCNTDAKALLEDVTETPDEVAAEGDGMAVTLTEIRSHYKPPAEGSSKTPPAPPSLIPTMSPPSLLSNIMPVPNNGGAGLSSASSSGSDSEDGNDEVFDVPRASPAASTSPSSSSASLSSSSLVPPSQQQQRKRLSPAELVATKLAEAAAAASSFAASLSIASSRGKGGTNSMYGSPNMDSNTTFSSSISGKQASGVSQASSNAERTRQQKQQQRAVLRTAAEMAVNGGARSPTPPSTQQQQQQQQQQLGGRAAGNTTATANSKAPKASWALPTPPTRTIPSSSASSAPAAATADAKEGRALCPSEWFVCDDVANHTRIFVIQGSDTLDHWKLNITFDPVFFEDPALGVKVHRGVYEAAQVLYKRFLPLVYEAIDSSPCAKICFTGHSVGGSLGTLLALMYRHRGVLPLDRLATLYTFGAPAVFCECGSEGEGCCEEAAVTEAGSPKPPLPSASRDQALDVATSHISGQGSQSDGLQMDGGGGTHTDSCCGGCCQEHGDGSKGLLAMLGLPNSLVRNVIMSRDIVPRAFACDYSLVADILKGWGPSFKDHGCLAREGRKHLYYFIGHMMVLQPDGGFHWFVGNNEPDHPMLPPGPNMLLVGSPTANGTQRNQRASKPGIISSSGQTMGKDADGGRSDGMGNSNSSSSSSSSRGSMRDGNHDGSMAFKAGSATTTPITTITASKGSGVPGAHTERHTGGTGQGSSTALGADAKHAGAKIHKSKGESPSPSPSPSPSRSGSPTGKASRSNGSRSSASRSESPRSSRSSSPSSMLPGFSMPQLPLPSLRPLSLPTSNSPSAPASAVVPMAVAEQKPVQQQQQQQQLQQQAPVRSHTDAVAALMDNPHPLDILADPGAYLSSGSISRYHNPDNYTAALGRLIFLKRKHEGRLPSWLFKTYSRMLRMEAELEVRSWEGRGQGTLEQQHPYVSAWDGTEMDIENHEAAARRPLEVHHW